MSVNSTNTSSLQQYSCSDIIHVSRVVKTILLLPVCTSVLFLGLQQWWRQRRSFTSHSDLFTLHLAAMELFWVSGFFCIISDEFLFLKIGKCACLVAFFGEIMFHVLTCVDRYLAVVHPVTYLGLKTSRGIRIRSVTIRCVWLLCFGLACIDLGVDSSYASIPLLWLLVLSIMAISFCSFFVLWVLIRSGPGAGNKDRIDQSKQRAFYTIMFLWSVLCLWFVVLLLRVITVRSPLYNDTVRCVMEVTLYCFNLLCSLVLPLIYLHKTVKQVSCSITQ